MKKIITIMLSLFILQSCAQEKKEKTMKKEERIEFLKKNIKHFKTQPIYILDYFTKVASEVYVNDILVYSNFTNISGFMKVPINSAILQSGEQKVKIILHPIADKDGNMDEFMHPETYLELKIKEAEWDEGSFIEKNPLLEYDTEKDASINSETFDHKKVWIKEFSFNASVPFKLAGWNESVNLKELNEKESIKPKVEAAFKAIWKDWSDQNSDAINTRNLVRQSEINIYDYRDEAYVDKQQNALEKAFKEQEGTSEMLPLENYEMYIMGNGKLVTLLRTDKENRMEPVMMKKYDNEEAEGVKSYFYFLHIPKGKTEFEVIR